jgi:hypothetical protein
MTRSYVRTRTRTRGHCRVLRHAGSRSRPTYTVGCKPGGATERHEVQAALRIRRESGRRR